jgi:hypothetical protein
MDLVHKVSKLSKTEDIHVAGTFQQTEKPSQTAWLSHQDGISVKSSLNDIKVFAYGAYDKLDQDADGFVTKAELSNGFTDPSVGWREKSFLLFLIRRIEDIAAAYTEEWADEKCGISRVDLQEYFDQIEVRDDGTCEARPRPEAWQKVPIPSGGINLAQTLQDIHDFALKTFDSLDQDGDGFLSQQELQNAATDELTGWREKSFLIFLMRNLEPISNAFDEEWAPENAGISRMDLQEYFRLLRI